MNSNCEKRIGTRRVGRVHRRLPRPDQHPFGERTKRVRMLIGFICLCRGLGHGRGDTPPGLGFFPGLLYNYLLPPLGCSCFPPLLCRHVFCNAFHFVFCPVVLVFIYYFSISSFHFFCFLPYDVGLGLFDSICFLLRKTSNLTKAFFSFLVRAKTNNSIGLHSMHVYVCVCG